MVSRVLEGVLKSYLGQYLELSDSSISMGSEIHLKNVRLKESALSDLGLPVKCVHGKVSKLVIKIPWFHLFADKTVIEVEGLHLLVVPSSSVKYDEAKEKRLQNEAKQKRLERTEEAKRLELEAKDAKGPKSDDGADDTFVERLVANIIKNLEVSIKKVHIRYEDKQTGTGRYPFAAGVTLEEVRMTTTKDAARDKDKVKLKVFEKYVVLDSFSIYWKPKASMYSEESKAKEDLFDVMFNQSIGTREKPVSRLKYLLGPISSDATLKWCPNPTLYNYEISEIDLVIQMKELCLALTKYQYQDFMMLLQSFEFMSRASKFRKYKARHNLENLPNYQGRLKDLWKFAFDCVYEEEVIRKINNWSWKHMKEHIQRCKNYREVYKTKLMAGSKATEHVLHDLRKHEDILDEVNIRIQRQLAEREVEKSAQEKIAAAAANASGGIWGWFGGGSKKVDNKEIEVNVKKFEEAMTSDEKEKLYEIIDYQENAHHGIFPKSFVAKKLSFHLDCLLIAIRDDDLNDADIITLNLSDVASNISQRPSAAFVQLAMTMKTLSVNGYQSSKKELQERPSIVSTRPGSQDGNLVNFCFENNPPEEPNGDLDIDPGSLYDQRLTFFSSPLEVVYHAPTVNRLIKIFKTPDDLNLSSLQHTAMSKLNEYKQSTTLGLQYVIDNHSLVDVNIELMSSFLILPHNGKLTKSCAVAVANLGSIKIRSRPISGETRHIKDMSLTDLTDTFKKSLRDQAYDKFIVTLEDMQMIVALPSEEWRTHVDRDTSPLFLLKPTSLEVTFQYCLIKNDPDMPLTKIKGSLKEISINISDYRLIRLAQIVDSLVDTLDEDKDLSLQRSESEGSMASAFSSLANTGSLVQQSMSNTITDIASAKKSDDLDSDSTGSLSHVTKLVLDFTINTVHLSLTQLDPSSNQDQRLFDFTIQKMAIDAKIRMFDITGEFRISEVNCEHRLLKTPNGKPVHILSTQKKGKKDAKLLTLKYTDVNKKSPEFGTVHQSVLKMLEVELTQVDINLHQDAILDIIGKAEKFIKELSSKAKNLLAGPDSQATPAVEDWGENDEDLFEDARSPRPGEDVPDPDTLLKRQNAKKAAHQLGGTKRQTSSGLGKWAFKSKKKPGSLENETIEVKINASLEGVTFDFMTNKVYFASMAVQDLNASYIQTIDQKVITARLVNFEVMDACNLGSDEPKTYYEKIAENLDEKVFDASITLYETTPEMKANHPEVVDVLVEAHMGRVKVVFLMKFVSDFLAFIDPFSGAREAVAEKATEALDSATKSMIDAYANATRAQLNIMMDAPLIIIPVHSTSKTTFIADLGKLKLSNRFSLSDGRVFDEMHFDMKDLKLLRGRIAEDIRSNDIESDCLIILPITFDLDLVRNMNGTKLKSDPPEISVTGTLQKITAQMSKGDYDVLMAILLNNFSQKGEFEQARSPQSVPNKDKTQMKLPLKSKHGGSRTSMQSQRSSQSLRDKVKAEERDPEAKAVEFQFAFEGFQADIFTGETLLEKVNADRDDNCALARLKVELIKTEGKLLCNGSIKAEAFLENCVLEDRRYYEAVEDSKRIVRLMEAKYASSPVSSDGKSVRMVKVDYERDSEGNQTLEAHVQSFVLVGSVAYLLEIAQFFVPDQTLNYEWSRPDIQVQTESEAAQKISVFVKVDEPDIFLVENIENINTDALMLNTEVQFKFWTTSGSMAMMASLDKVRCHTCRFNPEQREETMAQILQPCNLSFTISMNEGHGTRINMNISDLCLNVSPHSIIIIQNSVQAFIDSMAQKEADEKKAVTKKQEDLTDLWRTKPFKEEDFWFLKPDESVEALDYLSSAGSTQSIYSDEQAIININNLVIKVESGLGNNTIPLLLFESSFSCDIKNWSSPRMSAIGTLNLELAYYNAKLALWEPVIEPVCLIRPDETIMTRRWDLNLSLQSNSAHDFGSVVASPSYDDVDGFLCPEHLPPLMVIGLESRDVLEIAITKTFVGVLANLQQSFAEITDTKRKELPVAPFIVENQTGKKVTLTLESNGFKYYAQNERPGESKTKELPHDQSIYLFLSKDRAQTTTNYVSPLQEQTEQAEAILKIKVEGDKGYFELPVSKADCRFFPFQYRGDEWGNNHGMVSEIMVKNGCKYIIIRSVIQIKNHFDMTINILKSDGNSKYNKLAQLKPDDTFNVPLKDVYTDPFEFYFHIQGDQHMGLQSFNWRELIDKERHSQVIECSQRADDQDIFLNVEGMRKNIFFERTGSLESVSYVLDIRPILVFKNCLPVTLHYGYGSFLNDPKYIEPGQSGHMHGVKLGHTNIHIKIFGFRDCDWECTQVIEERMPELGLWRFTSVEGSEVAKFDLGINSIVSCGTQVISIYSPFWMVNKTGKMLTYRGQDPHNVIYHPIELENVPMMFSYTAKSFLGKRKASLRINDSQWSDPFTLDTIEDAGKVTCKKPETTGKNKITFSVGVNIAMSKSSLTKIITVTPYFLILNTAEFSISISEEESTEKWMDVLPGECVPFWPTQGACQVMAKITGLKETTPTFPMTSAHSTLLVVPNKYGAIHAEVRTSNSETLLTLSAYTKGLAPVLMINNCSNLMIEFWEKGVDATNFLPPGECRLFTWINPGGNRSFHWRIDGDDFKEEYTNDLISDGEGVIDNDKRADQHVGWVSFLNGMQRILVFTEDPTMCYKLARTTGENERIDQEIVTSIAGIGISVVNNNPLSSHELVYARITSSDIVWETMRKSKTRWKSLTRAQCDAIESDFQQYLREQSVGKRTSDERKIKNERDNSEIHINYETSRIAKPHEGRLRRQFQKGLWFQVRQSAHQRQIHAKINRIQVDNQLRDSLFPVILAPVQPPKSVVADSIPKPFIEMAVLQYTSPEHTNLTQYKYVHALVQELHIKIDQGLVNALMDLFEEEEILDENIHEFLKEDLELARKPLKSIAKLQATMGQKDFYDFLHLSPLKVHVSFSLTSYKSSHNSNSRRSNFFGLFLQSLGVTITDTDDIVFKLAYFERKHHFYSQQDLLYEMIRHYTSQAIKQAYVIIFGLDVIGNPFGLVVGVSRSVEDLFYEPFQGAVEGPSEFAEGLAIGVRSVFSGVVGGAAGTFSRITGAFGKGLASLTFDEKFQQKRREAIKKRGKQTVGESFARGGKGLVMGFFDGVTGVATKPIEGVREEGFGGFFKGVGKGVVGLVTRPTGGVVDFASGTFDSLKRVTEVSDETARVRPARFIHPDGVVRYYNLKEATGNKILNEVDKGKFVNTDTYVTHEEIAADSPSVFLVTNKRVIFIYYNQMMGNWLSDWSFDLSAIEGPPSHGGEEGQWYILIKPRGDDRKRFLGGLFGGDKSGKKICMKSRETVRNIARTIEELRIGQIN